MDSRLKEQSEKGAQFARITEQNVLVYFFFICDPILFICATSIINDYKF